MLNLEELKLALEHDRARKAPVEVTLADYPAARRLMLDAILHVEQSSLVMLERPKDVAEVGAQLDVAIRTIHAAKRALGIEEAD